MRATIKAGRLVIPKALRDHLRLRPGEVEVTTDGAGLRVEPLARDSLDERDGRLVIPGHSRDRRAREVYRVLDVDVELLA